MRPSALLQGPSAHAPDDVATFLDRIGAGRSMRYACAASGLPRQSVIQWLAAARDDADPREDVVAFARAYELEREKWVADLEERMEAHYLADWRALAAALRVADRERWGDGVSEAEAQQVAALRRRTARAEAELAEVKLALARVELDDRSPRTPAEDPSPEAE